MHAFMHGFENGSYAIVHHFSGQQLHKSAFLCNCCAKKRATIAHSVFGYHPAQLKPLRKIVPKGQLINIELLVQLIKPVL